MKIALSDKTFRDAKQYWGLEDFINVKEQPVKNALKVGNTVGIGFFKTKKST